MIISNDLISPSQDLLRFSRGIWNMQKKRRHGVETSTSKRFKWKARNLDFFFRICNSRNTTHVDAAHVITMLPASKQRSGSMLAFLH